MTAPYFVEVLSRGRDVRHRFRIDSLPIRIGRGYDNDVILDDPHVAVHHLVVEQGDGDCLELRDLGSRNGVIAGGVRKTDLQINGNTVFQLGHTLLRIRAADFLLDEDLPVSSFHRWEGWPLTVAGLALIIVVLSADYWYSEFTRFEASGYIAVMAVALCAGAVWCGMWAFANRLFGENPGLGRHVFILGCGFAVVELFQFGSGLAAYALSLETVSRYSSHVVIALLAGMIFFHLLQIKPKRVRELAASCLVLTLLGSGAMLLYNYGDHRTLADELVMTDRFPPAFRISSDRPVGRLMDDAARLKSRLDAERARVEREEEAEANGQE